ncbi:MAG: M3 family oligoendopeptidase [Cytophagaceae bacterium]|jgi:oligoendopeptidase F|nr:M3 family oligoendopeptidase [Cytophagaceae bacterium]
MLSIEKKNRNFLKPDFSITTWDTLVPYLEDLKNRKLNSGDDLLKWFHDRSELESLLEEDLGWRYIRMTGDTAKKEYTERYQYFITEIQPKLAPYSNAFDEKVLRSVFLKEMKRPGYSIAIRGIEKEFKIFREKNIPVITETDQLAQQFGAISGAMSVTIDGKELTMQQASDYMQSPDRSIRESAYKKIQERRQKDKNTLDDLFSRLVYLRNKIAVQADFKNYRDYMFTAMGRFDYSPADCMAFHTAVQEEVVPLMNELAQERRNALKVEQLKPWDLSINYFGTTPLKPFQNGADLVDKTIRCFGRIDAQLAECIETMKQMGHLDLESRKGKAPGGYNYPLDEIGIPFIFMNATSTLRDLVTMVHEGGHAFHSVLSKDLELNVFKHPPSEVAELASMSMELMSMEYWDIFFPDKKDLIRAKLEHLEGIVQTLPWVATIDCFQHALYERPEHSTEDRKKIWNEVYQRFASAEVNWTGQEKYRNYMWQKQLHLFEVPFYYIEYGMAQLGAIAVWKNFKENPQKGFAQYKEALKLGYTKSIPEVYQAAGIRFDFSRSYIRELMQFVRTEMEDLKKKSQTKK